MYFILFVLSFALNPLIIRYLPLEYTKEFLSCFATANLVFSLLFTLLFGNWKTAKNANYWIPILGLVILCFVSVFENKVLWFYYTFILLAADYSVTQTDSIKLSLYYRFYLIGSVFSLICFKDFFYEFIIFRSIVCSLFVIVVLLFKKDFSPLLVKSPLKMILITFTFYSGTLTLLPNIFDNKSLLNLKIWYVGMQIGLGLVLKELDFHTRANAVSSAFFVKVIKIGTLLLPFGVLFFLHIIKSNMSIASNVYAVVIYYVSLYALNQVKPMIN